MGSDNTHNQGDLAPSNDMPAPEPDPKNVRLLKIVVSVLGALLVAGAVVLVIAIIYKAAKLKKAPPVEGFRLETVLPPSASVLETRINGDHLVLRIRTASGEQVIVYNIRRGRETGRILLKK